MNEHRKDPVVVAQAILLVVVMAALLAAGVYAMYVGSARQDDQRQALIQSGSAAVVTKGSTDGLAHSICLDGVGYWQFDRSIAPRYSPEGAIVKCNQGSVK